jgi:hypothetical protein
MSLIESPTQVSVAAEVDPTFSSLRVGLRPHEFKGPLGSNVGGQYRQAWTTGATTLIAAGGAMLSVRWANPDRAFIINRVRVGVTVGTVFGAAQEVSCDLCRVTNMVNPDTGGTTLTVGESGRKGRSNMMPTVIADLRISAAAALAAGAGNIEETAMCATLMGGLLNVAGSMSMQTLFDMEAGHEGPIVMLRNEGFRIRNRTLMGAAGVLVWTFELDWSEIPTSLLGT